jgi:hypothetical protein
VFETLYPAAIPVYPWEGVNDMAVMRIMLGLGLVLGFSALLIGTPTEAQHKSTSAKETFAKFNAEFLQAFKGKDNCEVTWSRPDNHCGPGNGNGNSPNRGNGGGNLGGSGPGTGNGGSNNGQ